MPTLPRASGPHLRRATPASLFARSRCERTEAAPATPPAPLALDVGRGEEAVERRQHEDPPAEPDRQHDRQESSPDPRDLEQGLVTNEDAPQRALGSVPLHQA